VRVAGLLLFAASGSKNDRPRQVGPRGRALSSVTPEAVRRQAVQLAAPRLRRKARPAKSAMSSASRTSSARPSAGIGAGDRLACMTTFDAVDTGPGPDPLVALTVQE
jgi:hypothetical protein